MTAAGSATLDELRAELTRLKDREAIIETLYRYCHTHDYGLADDFADCFTGETLFNRGVAPTPLRDRDALRELIGGHPPDGSARKHYVMNPLIVFEGDAEARVHSYFIVLARSASGEAYISAYGRYADRMAKGEDGRWRLRERTNEIDYRELK